MSQQGIHSLSTSSFSLAALYSSLAARYVWAPRLRLNLLSVRGATEQRWNFTFKGNPVNIPKENGHELTGCQHRKGLFHILLSHNDTYTPADEDIALISATPKDRHRRFSHCGIEIIREIWRKGKVENLSFEGNTKEEQCIDCIMGKPFPSPHKNRRLRLASQSSAVLRMNTCGPIKTTSLGGNVTPY